MELWITGCLGPYSIIHSFGNGLYQIEEKATGKVIERVNGSHLKPFISNFSTVSYEKPSENLPYVKDNDAIPSHQDIALQEEQGQRARPIRFVLPL